METGNKVTSGSPQGSEFLKRYETILTVLMIGFSTFHLLVSAFRYVINWAPLKEYEYMAASFIFAAGLIYLIISFTFFKWNLPRVRALFTRMRSFEQIFLFLYLCWFTVSFLVNRSIGRPGFSVLNEWYVFDVLINAALLFPLAIILRGRHIRQIINGILLLILIAYSIFTIYGLWHILNLNFIALPSGSKLMMDESNQALKLGCHYNITGMQALLMLVLCLYFITAGKSRWRFLLLPNLLIQLFAANISNSRTVYVTGLVIVPIYLFLYIINRNAGNISRKSLTAAILTAVVVFILYYFSRHLSFYIFERLSGFNRVVLGAEDGIGSAIENIRELNNLNRRTAIWIRCIKVLFHDPVTFFFGVTPASIPKALINLGGYWTRADHAHNMVLQVGMNAGVPAMIAYCVFLWFICRKCLRFLLSGVRGKGNTDWHIPILILSLTIPCLVEYYIVSYHVMCGLFSIFTGWVVKMYMEKS